MIGVGLMTLTGCSTKGQVVTLDVQAVAPGGDAAGKAMGGDTNVAVGSFEDGRPQKNQIGVRHHLFGGETPFDVAGGKPGEVVGRVMGEYLKRKGWSINPNGAPDVAVSGKVLDFSADADSKLFSTEITVRTKVVVEAMNKADGSIVRMTLNGDGSQRVFWFEPEDVQKLLSEVLTESLEKLVVNTKMEDKQLRLK
jgi:uncharacterized lipoprotein YajG